jgi:hypothetical protein
LVASPPTIAAVLSPALSSALTASPIARSHDTSRSSPPSRTIGATIRSGEWNDWNP